MRWSLRNDDGTYTWEGEAPAELEHPHSRQERRPPVIPMRVRAPGMKQRQRVPG